MKSMIWKELRENVRWAALGCLALLLAEAYALSSSRALWNSYAGLSLCSAPFLFVSAFGCSALGAALGALQILPELRRDQWASLLHRPVPRHTIFLGKVIAGLLLYTLATGLPLFACVAYVATPGHFPVPFFPRLALPAASDLLLGGVFYFCALLLGLHKGRWIGLRVIIGLSAIAVLLLHLGGQSPFVLPLLGMAVLFIAAWGAMLGAVALRPWVSRCALGLAVFVGVQAGLLFLTAALQGLRRDSGNIMEDIDFQIARDGTVFRRKVAGGTSELTDMQGRVVTDERYAGNNEMNNALWPSYLADRRAIGLRRWESGGRTSLKTIEIMSDADTAELWFLVKWPGNYFVGYDRTSDRCIGFCDADGFKGPEAVPRSFAEEPQTVRTQDPPYLFWAGSKAFSVSFADRQLLLLADAGNDPVYGVTRFPQNLDQHRLAVALGSGIQIMDTHGALLTTVPYGYDAGQWPAICITATADFSQTFITYSPGYTPGYSPGAKDRARTMHLDTFDGQVQRTASYELEIESLRMTPPTWIGNVSQMTSVPVVSLWRSWRDEVASREGVPVVYETGILSPITGIGLPPGRLALLCGVALLLGVAAGVWAWRAGLARKQAVTWVIVTIVFGLPGFLAYRLSTAWPAQVRCPHCGGWRPVSTATCPRCQQAWETVAPSGAEIFEGV